MRASLVSLAGAVVIALQSWTFYYVVATEHRMTALEIKVDFLTQRELRHAPRPLPLGVPAAVTEGLQ